MTSLAPSLSLVLAAAIFVALSLYFLLGGADFGGGVWDLLARGPRAAAQRRAVEAAIGPIWEANHVWLILVVVVLFTAFPPAFAALSVALHVPLTIFVLGVVLRGSAFAFRGFDTRGDRHQRRWGLVFSVASTIAPLLLGTMVGALVSGRIRLDNGIVTSSFFTSWLAPFPVAVGFFALALCAFLAATYLTVELTDAGADILLREDFRRRALIAGATVGLLALVAFLFSGLGAPRVREALLLRRWSWPLHLLTATAATTALAALLRRRYRLARLAAAAQTVLILLGWALAQYPFMVVPDLTLAQAAASERVQRLLLIILLCGLPVLIPSLVVLFRVFKPKAR
jgi:cytochrome d ubiquinol oxidase subunit II